MEYLLKPSAIILIFYICYILFLQRDTFFEANRWFLLSGLLVASCISFIVIPQYIEYTPVKLTSIPVDIPIEVLESPIESEAFDYMSLLYYAYFLGVCFFVGRLAVQLLSLRKILRSGQQTRLGNYTLIKTNKDITPFSFFNYIVYNPTQFSTSEIEHVINHEKAHSKQFHSVDNILAQLVCILLWFNPIIWLYKKVLLQNLEFIADQEAQYISPCEKSYQTVLLKASIQNQELALTNNFYTSLIKKRIVMLHKSKSRKSNLIKLFFVLPLLAFFVMSFNIKEVYIEVPEAEETEAQDNETIEVIITKNTSDDDLKGIQETLKTKGITFTYNGVKRNSKGEITKINTTFKSNKNSSNYNVSGEDGIKSFQFTSSDDNFSVGSIDNNTFYLKSENGKAKIQTSSTSSNVFVIEDNDDQNETVDVQVTGDPDKVIITKKKNTFTISSDDEDTNIFINESDEPLLIIDGKRVEKSIFEDVDSDDIESVFVIKGERALEKYGDDGKNGVIVMTKKGSKKIITDVDSDENIIIESKSRVHIDADGKNKPLIIVDGEVIEEEEIQELNPNQIDKVEVIKDEKAVKAYGAKGKNGVIKIYTKDSRGSNNTEDSIIIVERSNSDIVHEKHDILINKSMTNSQLDLKKRQLAEIGIEAKFSKIRRNKSGEITSIKISLDDNNGRKSSASWREKNQAIPDIVMGKSNNDKLYIQAVGN